MYVPSDWATSNKRMAGFWGDARDAGNASAAYGIVEFMSGTDVDGSGPRFRGWEDGANSGAGTWVSMGLPAGFAYNSWVTIRIAMSTAHPGQFTYTIGNLSYTTTSVTTNPVKFGGAVLQGHNYNPAQPLDATNTGVTYDIYWDDFVQSTQTTGLDNLAAIQDVNTNYYFCTIQSAIDDATTLNGDTIKVGAGTYPENVNLDKWLTVKGAGNTTIIQPSASGPGISFNSPGANAMVRSWASISVTSPGFPHTRGDGPICESTMAEVVFSPHAWGWSAAGRPILRARFSPHAWGWSGSSRWPQSRSPGSPHTRGDGPHRWCRGQA